MGPKPEVAAQVMLIISMLHMLTDSKGKMCMYVQMHTVHVSVRAHICTYIHTHMWVYMYTCVCKCAHVCISVSVCVREYKYIYMNVFL